MWNGLRFIKRNLLGLVLIIADVIGINRLFNKINADKIRILCYHGVISKKLPTTYWTQLPLSEFEWQMNYLKKKMNIVRISECLDSDGRLKSELKSTAVITFDDGYENVFTEACPVLKKLELPAILFVVTSNTADGKYIWTDYLYDFIINSHYDEIDLTAYGLGRYNLDVSVEQRASVVEELKEALKSWPGEKRKELLHIMREHYPKRNPQIYDVLKLMTPAHIAELAGSGLFEIGSHSHHHPIMSTLTREQQLDEIKKSLDLLKEWGIPESGIFAYPNGRPQDFDDHTVAALKQNGIKAALTTSEGLQNPAGDKYRIKRILVASDVSKWEFKARLSGFYFSIQRLIRKLEPRRYVEH